MPLEAKAWNAKATRVATPLVLTNHPYTQYHVLKAYLLVFQQITVHRRFLYSIPPTYYVETIKSMIIVF